MSDKPILILKQSQQSLVERVRQALDKKNGVGPQPGPAPASSTPACLLLDVSASMEEYIDSQERKIDALRRLAREFSRERQFVFSHECVETRDIPEPYGSTAMHVAFEKIKAAGVRRAVLITDGYPDSELDAAKAARGLTLEIIYVGPQPEPPFLKKLAAATRGSYQATTLNRTTQPALQSRIRGLLG